MKEKLENGKATEKETTDVESSTIDADGLLAIRIGELTELQTDWFYSLNDRYDSEHCFEIIDIWKAKRGGINIEAFVKLADEINESEGKNREFYEHFTNSFAKSKDYLKHDIITKHIDARKATGLDPLRHDIATTAMADFKQLFLYHIDQLKNPDGGGTYQKYRNLVPILGMKASL